MKNYQISSEIHPSLNFFGSLNEIYEHVQTSGYKGKTRVQFGYPLPYGEDILIQESSKKLANTLRLSIEVWHVFDKIVQDHPEFSNRVDSISYLVELYQKMESFGPLTVKTPDSDKEFASLKEVIDLKPFWEGQGLTGKIELALGDG